MINMTKKSPVAAAVLTALIAGNTAPLPRFRQVYNWQKSKRWCEITVLKCNPLIRIKLKVFLNPT